MKFVRTILALVIAASVAMLPVGASAALAAKADAPVSMSVASSHDTASSMDMDCCPPEQPPCDKTGGCTSMAACAGTLLIFPASSAVSFQFPLVSAELIFPPVSQVLSSQKSSPPFRPPRA